MAKQFFDIEYLQTYSKNEFIIHRLSENEEKVYHYGEVLTTSRVLLDLLLKIDAKKTRVSIHCLQAPELCVILLSILNCECSFCGIPQNATEDECVDAVQKYDSSFCITYLPLKNNRLTLVKEICIFETQFYIFRVLNDKNGSNQLKSTNECYSINTSGSTGTPKVVRVPYQCIVPNIEGLSESLKLSRDDLILFSSPITFDPFVVEFFLALRNGASLLLTSYNIRLTPHRLADVLQPQQLRGASVIQMTPSLFRQFGLEPIQKKILKTSTSVRVLLLGGERFPSVKEISEWTAENNCNTRIFNIYGITEVSCWSTLHEITKTQMGKRVPIGDPIDSETEIRLMNENNEPVHEGFGDIQIGSAVRKCLIEGESPENIFSTEMLFRSTGDIGYISKGTIYFEGRKNESIKRYGQKVHLEKITRTILAIDGVLDAYCLFNENNMRLTYFIIKHGDKTKKEIQTEILSELKQFEKPDDIEFVDYFPLTSHGKISKEQLLHSYEADAITTAVQIFERFLTNVLCLDVGSGTMDKTKLNLSFLDAGGTSFQALTLATQIENVLQRPERKILEMLLSSTTKISSILEFIGQIDSSLAVARTACEYEKNLEMIELLRIKWQYDTGKCVDATPRCYKDVVCVGSHSHLLVTLDCISGREVSSCILPDRIECPVSFVDRHLILVGCYDGNLYAVDYLRGKIMWSFNCGGMIKAKPLQKRDLIVVANYSETGNLICINSKTKNALWKTHIGSKGIFSSPIQINKTSFLACTLSGETACIAFTTGDVLWKTKFQSPVFSTPALLSTEEVVVAEVSGVVHCLDVNLGFEVWKLETNGNIFSNVVVHCVKDEKYILFGNHDHNVYCFKSVPAVAPDSVTWKTTLNSAVYSTPAIVHTDKVFGVIACSTKGSIYVLDFFTGSKIFMLDLDNEIFSSPFIKENRIYVGCRNNNVVCIEIQC